MQIAIEPTGGGDGGYEFENKVTGGRIPREYIPSVDAGCQEAMEFGVLAGYPMVDVKVTLLDGAYHEVDSSELAFKIAGSMAFKEAARKADPVLLEPMMASRCSPPRTTWVTSSATSTPGVARSRRWRSAAAPGSSRPWSRCRRCSATSATCASKTQGRASYTMQFDSYAEVPRNGGGDHERRPAASSSRPRAGRTTTEARRDGRQSAS